MHNFVLLGCLFGVSVGNPIISTATTSNPVIITTPSYSMVGGGGGGGYMGTSAFPFNQLQPLEKTCVFGGGEFER